MWTSVMEPRILSKQLKTCEVAVGALASQTGRTPVVVSEEMVSNMRPGSVIIDVSIDRGGCFETSEITSHEHPIFMKYGVIHYCVPNMPGAYGSTSTLALTNVTVHHLQTLAATPLARLPKLHRGLAKGIQIHAGHVVCRPVADAQRLAAIPLESVLS